MSEYSPIVIVEKDDVVDSLVSFQHGGLDAIVYIVSPEVSDSIYHYNWNRFIDCVGEKGKIESLSKKCFAALTLEGDGRLICGSRLIEKSTTNHIQISELDRRVEEFTKNVVGRLVENIVVAKKINPLFFKYLELFDIKYSRFNA